jgi:rubredoxin
VTVLDAVITCPSCGAQSREVMPENASQHFYRCTGCGKVLRPREGDCCVFCSYSDQLCPPKQGGSG